MVHAPLPVRLALGRTGSVLHEHAAERIVRQGLRIRGMLHSEGYELQDNPTHTPVFTLHMFGVPEEPFCAPLITSTSLAEQSKIVDAYVRDLGDLDAAGLGVNVDSALAILDDMTRTAHDTLKMVCHYHPAFANPVFRTQLYLPYAKGLVAKLQTDAGYAGSVATAWERPSGHRQAVIGAIQALGAGLAQVPETVLPKVEGLRVARTLLDHLGRNPARSALEAWLAGAAHIVGVESTTLPTTVVDFGDVLPLQLPRLPFAIAPLSGAGLRAEAWEAPFRYVTGDSNIGRYNSPGPYCIAATPYIGRYLGQIFSGIFQRVE